MAEALPLDGWRVCGFVDLWVCGFVGLWICGFVGLLVWGSEEGAPLDPGGCAVGSLRTWEAARVLERSEYSPYSPSLP